MKKILTLLLIFTVVSTAYGETTKVGCVGNNQTDNYECTMKYSKGIFNTVYTIIPAVDNNDEMLVRLGGNINLYEIADKLSIKLYYRKEFGSNSDSSYDAKWLKVTYLY